MKTFVLIAMLIAIRYAFFCKFCALKKHNPVCGKDGKTYINMCFLKCNKVELHYEGMCKIEACGCTIDIDVVCGDDG